jgi:hypothetical protein
VYYIIADNPASDVCHYPDTNKWQVPGLPNLVRVAAVSNNCYEGEE